MKRLAKGLWRMSWPVRRPIQGRVETFLAESLARALERQNPARVVADEVSLVLDAVIAEQFRLREQIEDLRQTLDDHSSTRNSSIPPHSQA
jgi:hypothetical protein